MSSADATICALATPPGRSGVAVIRLSGQNAFEASKRLVGTLPAARFASLRSVRRLDGELLDKGLVIAFPQPNSFTGEDVVELQLHGSAAVIKAVLFELQATGLVRLARPGEFTQRALFNDKLDITQAEGLAALIDAETEGQRKVAQRTLDGVLSQAVDVWRAKLVEAMSLLEASIDFSDEEIPSDLIDRAHTRIRELRGLLTEEIVSVRRAERMRDGFEVAIIGEPNVGKSTLINAISGKAVALTSDIAGTTRDIIQTRIDIGGVPVVFLDTAGLRSTDDPVEAMGVDMAVARAESADMRVFLKGTPSEQALIRPMGDDIVLRPKDDLGEHEDGISGLSGIGIDRLLDVIGERVAGMASEISVATHLRHAEVIESVIAKLDDALLTAPEYIEVSAAHLRTASQMLDALIGRVDVEHLLDQIFSRFCIGK